MPGDCFEDAIEVFQHLIVPESEHLVALRLEILCAALVGFALCLFVMLAAVQLDYQARLEAEEVGNVGFDGLLAAELGTLDLAVAQARPQFSRRVGVGQASALARSLARIGGVSGLNSEFFIRGPSA